MRARQALKDAGATLVATTLAETREYLEGLVEIPRIPAPDVPTSDLTLRRTASRDDL